MPQDKIIKAMAFDQSIRIYGVLAMNTVDEIKNRVHATPEVTVALGRLAMGSLLIGALDSSAAKIYIKVHGNGLIGTMNADSDAHGNVRAYASNPEVLGGIQEAGTFDIASIVGNRGFLYVIKDLGLKEDFTSATQLVTGDLNSDFAQYFAESQQTPTTMCVDVLMHGEEVMIAGGFVAQGLPGVSAEAMAQLQENIQQITPFTDFLTEHSLEELLKVLASGSFVTLEEIPVQFACNCSKERFLRAFATLPRAELQAMIADAQDEEVICPYCGKKYYIANEELQEIFENEKTKEGR